MYDRFKNFTVMILNIHRAIQKIKAEEMQDLDLNPPHVSCLYYLYKENFLTATELCEICQEDKSYISRALKKLEENGYVFCDSVGGKRYNSPLTLTEKGRELGAYIVDKVDSVLEPASDGISEEEREVLYKCLTRINDNLDKICKQYDATSKGKL